MEANGGNIDTEAETQVRLDWFIFVVIHVEFSGNCQPGNKDILIQTSFNWFK